MASHGGQENATVERHDSQHHQIRKSNPQSMQQSLNQTGGHVFGGTGFHEPRVRNPLHHESKLEDNYEGQDIHTGSGSWPTGEENLGIATPEEGHMHHHLMVVRHVHAAI